MKILPLSLAAAFALATAGAQAAGTITIRQNDGSTNVYDNATVKVIHGALYVTSADGKGTIVIHKAACHYQGKVMVCFATSATLVQSGQTSALDLKSGTVYLNSTDEAQGIPFTSMKLPPNGIWLSLTTDRGTYVGMTGRIDKVVN